MRPAMLAALILAACLALSGLAGAQAPGAGPSPAPAASPAGPPESPPLTEEEWKVFRDLVDSWHRFYCRPDLTEEEASENRLPLRIAVCALHKIPLDRLRDIEERADYDLHITGRESDAMFFLFDDLWNLPEGATQAQYDQIHEQLSREMGIPMDRLHMIEYIYFVELR